VPNQVLKRFPRAYQWDMASGALRGVMEHGLIERLVLGQQYIHPLFTREAASAFMRSVLGALAFRAGYRVFGKDAHDRFLSNEGGRMDALATAERVMARFFNAPRGVAKVFSILADTPDHIVKAVMSYKGSKGLEALHRAVNFAEDSVARARHGAGLLLAMVHSKAYRDMAREDAARAIKGAAGEAGLEFSQEGLEEATRKLAPANGLARLLVEGGDVREALAASMAMTKDKRLAGAAKSLYLGEALRHDIREALDPSKAAQGGQGSQNTQNAQGTQKGGQAAQGAQQGAQGIQGETAVATAPEAASKTGTATGTEPTQETEKKRDEEKLNIDAVARALKDKADAALAALRDAPPSADYAKVKEVIGRLLGREGVEKLKLALERGFLDSTIKASLEAHKEVAECISADSAKGCLAMASHIDARGLGRAADLVEKIKATEDINQLEGEIAKHLGDKAAAFEREYNEIYRAAKEEIMKRAQEELEKAQTEEERAQILEKANRKLRAAREIAAKAALVWAAFRDKSGAVAIAGEEELKGQLQRVFKEEILGKAKEIFRASASPEEGLERVARYLGLDVQGVKGWEDVERAVDNVSREAAERAFQEVGKERLAALLVLRAGEYVGAVRAVEVVDRFRGLYRSGDLGKAVGDSQLLRSLGNLDRRLSDLEEAYRVVSSERAFEDAYKGLVKGSEGRLVDPRLSEQFLGRAMRNKEVWQAFELLGVDASGLSEEERAALGAGAFLNARVRSELLGNMGARYARLSKGGSVLDMVNQKLYLRVQGSVGGRAAEDHIEVDAPFYVEDYRNFGDRLLWLRSLGFKVSKEDVARAAIRIGVEEKGGYSALYDAVRGSRRALERLRAYTDTVVGELRSRPGFGEYLSAYAKKAASKDQAFLAFSYALTEILYMANVMTRAMAEGFVQAARTIPFFGAYAAMYAPMALSLGYVGEAFTRAAARRIEERALRAHRAAQRYF